MERTPSPQHRSVPEWVLLLGFLAVALALYLAVPAVRGTVNEAYSVLASGDRAQIHAWVRTFGAWGPATLLGLNVAQTVLAFIPALPIMVVAVLAYGPLWGSLLAWIGLLVAASMGYGIGKLFGERALRRHLSPVAAARVTELVERYGLWAVALSRLTPLVPTDGVSLLAGVVGMGYWRFLLATAAGTAPVCVLLAFFGADFEQLLWALGGATVVGAAAFYVLTRIRHARTAD